MALYELAGDKWYQFKHGRWQTMTTPNDTNMETQETQQTQETEPQAQEAGEQVHALKWLEDKHGWACPQCGLIIAVYPKSKKKKKKGKGNNAPQEAAPEQNTEEIVKPPHAATRQPFEAPSQEPAQQS